MVVFMIEQIKEKMGNSKDLVVRELDLYNEKVSLVFFECLCDSRNINDFVLEYLSYLKANKKIILNLKEYVKNTNEKFLEKEVRKKITSLKNKKKLLNVGTF